MKTRGFIQFGHDLLIMAAFALIGLASVLAGIVYLIIWLVKHVQFVAIALTLVLCTGCDQFRDRVETQRIRVERNDPKTGKPIKIGFIASEKPVKVPVVYELEDGSTITEEIDVNGFDVSPPPLPEK